MVQRFNVKQQMEWAQIGSREEWSRFREVAILSNWLIRQPILFSSLRIVKLRLPGLEVDERWKVLAGQYRWPIQSQVIRSLEIHERQSRPRKKRILCCRRSSPFLEYVDWHILQKSRFSPNFPKANRFRQTTLGVIPQEARLEPMILIYVYHILSYSL